MQYVKVTFEITGNATGDVLMALLADAGYNGFEEKEHEILAYIDDAGFNEADLKEIAAKTGFGYNTELIPSQNWNALWESNFQPVIVDGFCTIRADFHNIEVTTPYDIIITPKMSFGTGHHATTQLMMLMMKDIPMNGKSVLDFGTGTGVLAILAEKLGAATALAIDNDEWPVENAKENITRNHCQRITVLRGSLENAGTDKRDIILANINRNILLQYMASLYEKLNNGGIIFMSGLLMEDAPVIQQAAAGAGFHYIKMLEQANWIALLFEKQ